MRNVTKFGALVGLAFLVFLMTPVRGQAPAMTQLMATERSLSASKSNAAALDDLRTWDQAVTVLRRDARLQRVSLEADRLVLGRVHERLQQFHEGVRVFGGEVARQTNDFGQPISVFGTIYDGITVDPVPAIAADRAATLLGTAGEGIVGGTSEQELVVLPVDGGARLTWTARVLSTRDGHVERLFIDASTGAKVFAFDETWTQIAARTTGTGMAGDQLTMPIEIAGNFLSRAFLAIDLERPGANTTFDLKGDPVRTTAILNGTTALSETDIAADRDNRWTDVVVVAAHTYASYTYDYYLREFNRHGLNNANLRYRLIVNPANPTTASTLGSTYSRLFNNAAYYGNGLVAFGVGSISAGGILTARNFGGAIDIVAHELTHGVTRFTSNLTYLNESGALNEAFSDMMSVAVEFDNQPLGSGLARADWLQGEDATVSGTGLRNFMTPSVKGHPDHYSLKIIVPTTSDSGGVHTNSSIVNHMFFLAIMGGTNRISGLSVTGVGFANRKQIEHVIYRAFAQLLTPSSQFTAARAACIQAARDLYGVGSAAEIAITQAWTAVGVV